MTTTDTKAKVDFCFPWYATGQAQGIMGAGPNGPRMMAIPATNRTEALAVRDEIIRRCNLHDELTAGLRRIAQLESQGCMAAQDIARALLTKTLR